MTQIHRILFIRTDRIGDVLMNLAAIRTIRRAYPKAWITLVLDESLNGLLNAHPDIDEVLFVSIKKFSSELRERFIFLKKIKAARFDLAIVANAGKWMHAVVFLAGIRQRVGWGRKWGFLLSQTLQDDKAVAQRHEIDSNLGLARLLGAPVWDKTLELPADPWALKRLEERAQSSGISDKKIIAVHPGTSNPAKRWPEALFAELCDRLAEDPSLQVILIGGPEERASSEEVRRLTRAKSLDWTGQFTLAELNAFLRLKNVKALVSVDSGPVHVAWIGGTPVVALYAQNVPGSDPARWGPRDGKSEVIFKPISTITVAEVYDALKRVLAK